MYQEQINIIKNASLSIIFLLAFSFLAWADETNKNLVLADIASKGNAIGNKGSRMLNCTIMPIEVKDGKITGAEIAHAVYYFVKEDGSIISENMNINTEEKVPYRLTEEKLEPWMVTIIDLDRNKIYGLMYSWDKGNGLKDYYCEGQVFFIKGSAKNSGINFVNINGKKVTKGLVKATAEGIVPLHEPELDVKLQHLFDAP
jgi:hypothetical protein